MEKYKVDFIKKISNAVKKYAPKYNICVYSPIIAQAILESAWGKSKLSQYYNFFGMKTGSAYTGDKITFETREVINGKSVTVKADFRAYKSAAGGIKGYFDFINTARYSNLKGVTDPKKYLENIKADGYATDPNYVYSLIAVIDNYDLRQFDPVRTQPEKQPKQTEKKSINDWSIEKCFDIIADDIIKRVNWWGCGDVRKNRLYNEIQTRINRMIYSKINQIPGGSIDAALNFIASDIIKNPAKWGTGEDRKNKLFTEAQKHVNSKVRV